MSWLNPEDSNYLKGALSVEQNRSEAIVRAAAAEQSRRVDVATAEQGLSVFEQAYSLKKRYDEIELAAANWPAAQKRETLQQINQLRDRADGLVFDALNDADNIFPNNLPIEQVAFQGAGDDVVRLKALVSSANGELPDLPSIRAGAGEGVVPSVPERSTYSGKKLAEIWGSDGVVQKSASPGLTGTFATLPSVGLGVGWALESLWNSARNVRDYTRQAAQYVGYAYGSGNNQYYRYALGATVMAGAYGTDFAFRPGSAGVRAAVELSERAAARNVANTGADFMSATGRLDGQLYSPAKLTQLSSYLERRGIELKVGDEFVPFGKAGGFDATNGQLILRSNPTQYEVWHELSHFRQYQTIGKDAYLSLPRSTAFNAPEQFVFDMLENSPKRWNALNFEEQQHAIRYIEKVGGFR